MVLMNVPGGRTDQFFVDFGLPYVHVTSAQRDTVLQYVQSSNSAATATLNPAKAKLGQTAPAMAEFSSRGPIPTANAVVLKPDVTAPGVNVFAAYSDEHVYISGAWHFLHRSAATPAVNQNQMSNHVHQQPATSYQHGCIQHSSTLEAPCFKRFYRFLLPPSLNWCMLMLHYLAGSSTCRWHI
jgi:hypothetical protein